MTKTNRDQNYSSPEAAETYLAPPPPADGKIIGVDGHPDTFTAAVFVGTTVHNARQVSCRQDLGLDAFLAWAQSEFDARDLFLIESNANSFELWRRLRAMGLRATVLDSVHVARHAKSYADNDKMAAARIAWVYLAGAAPAVWVPDPKTCERRELLHAYQKAVRDQTAAINSLKGYLNQFAVRLGRRQPATATTRQWILAQRDWSPLQRELLADAFAQLESHTSRRRHFVRLIGQEICAEPLMLRCMKLLGISKINAFALLAVIGDIRRFDNPAKLVAYAGLNPGQRQSGHGKHIKLGLGRRGRGDLRHLLVQGAHAVLRTGKRTALGQWGWKLFARKGHRNIAVAAVARKMLVQVWHLLSGNPPTTLEPDKSLVIKLEKLVVLLGKEWRTRIGLTGKLTQCIAQLQTRMLAPQAPQTDGGYAPPNPAPLAAEAFGGNLMLPACGR